MPAKNDTASKTIRFKKVKDTRNFDVYEEVEAPNTTGIYLRKSLVAELDLGDEVEITVSKV